jgi:hypothetical protein
MGTPIIMGFPTGRLSGGELSYMIFDNQYRMQNNPDKAERLTIAGGIQML